MSLILKRDKGSRLTMADLDNNFELLSSGGGIISDTYANWVTTQGNNLLPAGYHIFISDRGDAGLIAFCTTPNTIDENAIASFYVADFQLVGQLSSNIRGVWKQLSESGYNNADIVIWNNSHYEVVDITSINGTPPDQNGNAYSILTANLTEGYILDWDKVQYNFGSDVLYWREDKRGNRIPLGGSNLTNFQWGDDNIHDFIINTYEVTIDTLNNSGTITGTITGTSAYVYLYSNQGSIFVDVNGNYQAYYAPYNTGSIEGHVRGFSSGIQTNNNSGTIVIYVEDTSYFWADSNSGEIYATYKNNSYVSHYNNQGDVMHCEFNGFGYGWSFSTISLNNDTSHYECSYSNDMSVFTFPTDISYSKCVLTNTISTFSVNLYIDQVLSGTTLDLSGYQYCGIINILELCLAKGTRILLSNYSYKNIEDITYEDALMVWNFDEGRFDSAKPLWIKLPGTSNKYNLLTFSDGTELKTISQHRIFNKERGMFTYPMTEDTPIGTTTFNSHSKEIKLISKEVINEDVEYYNIITSGHINLFGNDILTSCRYNNIYPIENMKFIKDNRNMRERNEFENIPNKYYEGLRLAEQVFDLSAIEKYVNNLLKFENYECFIS